MKPNILQNTTRTVIYSSQHILHTWCLTFLAQNRPSSAAEVFLCRADIWEAVTLSSPAASFFISFILNRLNIIKSHFHFFYTLSAKDKMAAISKKNIISLRSQSFLFFLFHLQDLNQWNKSRERVLTANRSLSEQKENHGHFYSALSIKIIIH